MIRRTPRSTRTDTRLPYTTLFRSTVNQGEAAVQIVASSRDRGLPFSAAFLDVRMPPGINGLEAAVQIREIDASLPIAIVTAYTDIPTIDIAKAIPPPTRIFVLPTTFPTPAIQHLASALHHRGEPKP